MFFTGVFVAGMFALKIAALSDNGNVGNNAVTAQLLVLAFVGSDLILVAGMFKNMQKLRSQERLLHTETFLSQRIKKTPQNANIKAS